MYVYIYIYIYIYILLYIVIYMYRQIDRQLQDSAWKIISCVLHLMLKPWQRGQTSI